MYRLVRIGILSAVMAIKHMASHSENESNAWPDKSSDDFEENSLSEKAKKALPFLSEFSFFCFFWGRGHFLV